MAVRDAILSRTTMMSANLTAANETNFSKVRGLEDLEITLMTFFLVSLVLAILFGNGLIIGIFYKYAPIRTVTNFFIVSLAISDMLVALLSIPLWIAYVHYDLFADAHGDEVCVFSHLSALA